MKHPMTQAIMFTTVLEILSSAQAKDLGGERLVEDGESWNISGDIEFASRRTCMDTLSAFCGMAVNQTNLGTITFMAAGSDYAGHSLITVINLRAVGARMSRNNDSASKCVVIV